jgi:hypothetical protein
MNLAPFNAWVVLKGMETLVHSHEGTKRRGIAAGVSGWRRTPPWPACITPACHRTRSTHWPCASSRVLGGAVLAFDVRSKAMRCVRVRAAAAFHVIDSTRVCSITANLGDTKTTITHPASTSHGRLSEAQRQAAGIGQGLIRVAVGLEHIDDLKADLARGLDTLHMTEKNTAVPLKVRTRFAPSPTGFIHLGNIRSALYPWAFARATGGDFILRIEDTDLERSTQAAVDVILEGMSLAGYGSRRRSVLPNAAHGPLQRSAGCNCKRPAMSTRATPAWLSWMPCAKRKWPPKKSHATTAPGARSPAKRCRRCPKACSQCCASKTRKGGVVAWDDKVKGRIEIRNDELDDLVIARPDGTPTYNFCVVVDDIDMAITHVIRGDDHVNNTPRQINIFRSAGQGRRRCMPTCPRC